MDAANRKDIDGAIRAWQQGIQADPRYPDNYEQLGGLFLTLRRYPEAADLYAEATRLSPDSGALFLGLAKARQMLRDSKGAETAARRAAQLMPDSADAVGLFGVLAAKNKEGVVALSALQRAHTLAPNNPDYTIALVYGEMDKGDMPSAERDLAPYVRDHPNDTQACFQMSIIEGLKPRTPETLRQAIAYGRLALPGMRRDTRIYSQLGMLYLDAGQPQEALRLFSQGWQYAPNSEVILHGLQDSYARIGNAPQAEAFGGLLQKAAARHDRIDHLKHVMGFNHNDITSGLELARLLEEDGDSAQALVNYQLLIHQAPHDTRPRAAAAAFFRRAGHPDMAKVILRPDYLPPLPAS